MEGYDFLLILVIVTPKKCQRLDDTLQFRSYAEASLLVNSSTSWRSSVIVIVCDNDIPGVFVGTGIAWHCIMLLYPRQSLPPFLRDQKSPKEQLLLGLRPFCGFVLPRTAQGFFQRSLLFQRRPAKDAEVRAKTEGTSLGLTSHLYYTFTKMT